MLINRLKELEGTLSLSGEEWVLPRLEKVGELNMSAPPTIIRLPRLRRVEGNLTAGEFSWNDTEAIILPQLTHIGGNVEIGQRDNTGAFKKLDLPRLKTVSRDFFVRFSWSFFEEQHWPNLEQVGSLTIEGGGYLSAPKLRLVSGDLKHVVRTNLTDQEMTLDFPELTEVGGDLTYEAPFRNDERISLNSIELPLLTTVNDISIRPEVFLPVTFRAPSLAIAGDLSVHAATFDLAALQAVNAMVIRGSNTTELLLPQLSRADRIQVLGSESEPVLSIKAPKLETVTSISLNAKNLDYRALTQITGFPSIEFDNDIEAANFSAMESLERLTLANGDYQNLDFSALESLERLSVNGVSGLGVQFGTPKIEQFELRNIESTTNISWLAEAMEVSDFTITDTNAPNVQLDISKANAISISNSSLKGNVLSSLINLKTLRISGSTFQQSLDISQLLSANSISASFDEPTAVNLSSLRALGSIGDSPNSLAFNNVTDLNLNALLQAPGIGINAGSDQTESVLRSIDLGSLRTVGGLKLVSDQLTSVNLGSLSLAGEINVRSNSLRTLNLSSLQTIQTLQINSESLTSVGLSSLARVEEFGIQNALVGRVTLSNLREAGSLTFSNLSRLTTINLSSLPRMGLLRLNLLPLLSDIVTTAPGENAGLRADLAINAIPEITENITCDNGQSMSRTFYPVVESYTLGCESYEIGEEQYSTRPYVEERIVFISDVDGDGYRFDETIPFPSILVSENRFNFPNLNEETEESSLSFYLTNTGTEDANISLSIENDEHNAFQLDESNIMLSPGENMRLSVTFSPSVVGEHDAMVVVQTDDRLELPTIGTKEGCVELAGICITAQNIRPQEAGVFKLTGGVIMNNFLKFSGEVTANINDGTLEGEGEVSVTLPYSEEAAFSGDVVIYRGAFGFTLTNAVEKLFATTLESGANNFLKLANLPVEMGGLQFIESGIQFSASMTLPPQLKNTEVTLENVSITSTEGVNVVGEITVPGSIKLGGVSELRDLSFGFNTVENEFSGSATLGTKLFDMEGTVVMSGGGLDEVEVVIIPARPVPVGPTGWSLTEGKGSIENIQAPPVILGLSVDMAPTVAANFDLVKLHDLGLRYEFGKRLQGSGSLEILGESVARASIDIQSNLLKLQGEVNFGNFLVGQAMLAVDNTGAGLQLKGELEAKLQIPEGDSFFYQIFDAMLGLPYEVASTRATLNNTKLSGETTILGYGVAYGVAYIGFADFC